MSNDLHGAHEARERHVSVGALEAYVTGMLDDAGIADVERHVSACPPCERALMREARLETAFEQVVRGSSRPAGRPGERASRVSPFRGGAIAGGAVGALAMAAAVVLWVVPASTHGGVTHTLGEQVAAEANVGPQPNMHAGDAADDGQSADARDGG